MANKINKLNLTPRGRVPRPLFLMLTGLAIAALTALVWLTLFTWGMMAGDADYLRTAKEDVFRPGVRGMIVPHHLLVESFMEDFYAGIGRENHYERVVILSPNHFGLGFHHLQSTDLLENSSLQLDQDWIDSLVASGAVFVEEGDFPMEHGLYVEYPFIAKHFPEAKIVPIMIKKETPCAVLTDLANHLQRLNAGAEGKTLFIASLDFTHVSDENLALKNDRETVTWLKNISSQTGASDARFCADSKALAVGNERDNPDAVGIDSGEVLFVLTRMMVKDKADTFTFWNRTSSISLAPSTKAGENTSHIFGYFSSGPASGSIAADVSGNAP